MNTRLDDKNAKLIIKALIPGVKKEEINLIISEKKFRLYAGKKNIFFEISLPLCRQVNPHEAQASYESGRLIVEVPVKKDATTEVNVFIQ